LQDANPTIQPYEMPPPSILTAQQASPLASIFGSRIAHPGSNAATVTPSKPKFTKMGEDLSG